MHGMAMLQTDLVPSGIPLQEHFRPRRRTREQDSDLAQQALTASDPSEARAAARRLRNRISAEKSRQRQAQALALAQRHVEELQATNRALLDRVAALESTAPRGIPAPHPTASAGSAHPLRLAARWGPTARRAAGA